MTLHKKPRAALAMLAALAFSAAAYAAPVRVQPREEYTRLLFPFDQPATLNVGGGGNSVILNFNQPVSQDLTTLQPQLAPLVVGVQQSADGHQVILNLKENYRVRQFVSGNTVGIDIMRSAVDAPAAPASIMSTKTSTEPTPHEEKPQVPLETSSNAPDLRVIRTDNAAASILTTKEPAAPVATQPDAPATPPPVEEESTAVAAQAAPSAEPTAAAANTAEKIVPQDHARTPFLVGVQPIKEGTLLDFPWQERVAAAVFERGPDIWLVFSKQVDVNSNLLKTVLPTSVIRLDQFGYDGNTVLRLTTDGNLHAKINQPANSYHWQVTLATKGNEATLDIPISGERDVNGKSFLQLNAYDVAEPLNFFDPSIGDLLIVIPAFEAGRGVVTPFTTPELSVLPTPQGVAITSLRDQLGSERSRTGVKIYAPQALSLSQNLPAPTANAPAPPPNSTAPKVMIPYERWYVSPSDFTEVEHTRLAALANAPTTARPDALLHLVQLYLGQSMGVEAQGYLTLLEGSYPTYYRDQRLALLHAAANLLTNRVDEARQHINAAELNDVPEAQLWRDAIAMYRPAPSLAQQAMTGDSLPPVTAAMFDYLRYDKPFIRYYPPRLRQRLAILAADRYLQNAQPEKALAVYESLNRDGVLDGVQPYAELTLANIAIKKNKIKQARIVLDRLASQPADTYIQARARYDRLMLQMAQNEVTPAEAIDALERIRLIWRGDGLERQVLFMLGTLYKQEKQYDEALRAWKDLLRAFPGDPDTLTIAGDMTEMFSDLFLDGQADSMSPLKALGLFYEFRELTPLGEKGDQMIQKLADRLAAVDLLERATQLLEHQIRYRVQGVERARVGARLALLYMLNKQPKRALEVLDLTNYGALSDPLKRQRTQLTAQAMAENGSPEEALSLLYTDRTLDGAYERLDILWDMQDWPNVIDTAEDILSRRTALAEPLTARETPAVLKLALAYSFTNDPTQLRYLRDYYMNLVPEGPYKEIFDYITNDTMPLDTADFSLVAQQISRTENFMDSFKQKIAAGRLSDVGADQPDERATPSDTIIDPATTPPASPLTPPTAEEEASPADAAANEGDTPADAQAEDTGADGEAPANE